MRRAAGDLRRSERGAVLIETALVFPLVLFMAVGIFEFGRAYQTWQVVTNAAREGARIAVLPGTSDAAVTTRVQEYLAAGQLGAAASATVNVTRNNQISIGAGTASASRVQVTYPFEFVVLQPIANLVAPEADLGGPLPITTSALMRNES
jgi:Flp pilus assembly protein TadG